MKPLEFGHELESRVENMNYHEEWVLRPCRYLRFGTLA